MSARRAQDLFASPGAIVALGLIVAALALGGAQSAANAALLATLLSLTFFVVALRAPGQSVVALVNQHWLPILAAICFVTYAMASVWIAPTWSRQLAPPSPLTTAPPVRAAGG